MKEEALKLADELDALHQYVPSEAPVMIRRLVEELDKKTKPTITKVDDKVVAVTMTDDEHRITEVLWEAQKPLSDEEILNSWVEIDLPEECWITDEQLINFARTIEERHGIK